MNSVFVRLGTIEINLILPFIVAENLKLLLSNLEGSVLSLQNGGNHVTLESLL
jgi:hypothetical protein